MIVYLHISDPHLRIESTQVMCQNDSGGLFSIPFLCSPSTKISSPLQWSSHSHYRKGARCWVSEKTGRICKSCLHGSYQDCPCRILSSKTQIPTICGHLRETCSPQATTSSDINWYLSLCLY